MWRSRHAAAVLGSIGAEAYCCTHREPLHVMSWTHPARIGWGLFRPVEVRGGVILEVSFVLCLRSRQRPRSIPAGSQPYHAFPAPDGSRGSPKDTRLVDFVFARTTGESVGHRRTRHRHGSGP